MITIGIDIGLTGAVASVNHLGGAAVLDLVTVPSGKSRRLDGRDLIHTLRAMAPSSESALVLIEDVQPRPMGNGGRAGNTMHSQASLMRSRGIVEAVCDVGGFQLRSVQPQPWKRFYGLIGEDKDASIDCARRLFPACAIDLKRKKDQNRAEALLIANYAQRNMT